MICAYNHLTVISASYGTALLCSINRDGLENNILKEKNAEVNEFYRKYYCSNCKQHFDGEQDNCFEAVRQHIGTEPWHNINEHEITDLSDPNIRPTIKKQLEAFL